MTIPEQAPSESSQSGAVPPSQQVTQLLREIELETPGAVDQLVGLVYDDLRRMAGARMRSIPPWDTLQPTALVNEVFMKLFGDSAPSWVNRRQFFHAASRAMRDILVDRARGALAQKRGSGQRGAQLTDDSLLYKESESILHINEALEHLKADFPRQAEVVELKYFVGLNLDQIALTLDCSRNTAHRDWMLAKAWLARRLQEQ
jgi:RNA polymerase sigma factor (TIGR02999 family)